MNYFERGIAKARHGDHSGAIEDFNIGIRMNPGDARLYLAKGISIAELKSKKIVGEGKIDTELIQFTLQNSHRKILGR